MERTVELYCGAEKPFSQIAAALGYATFTVDPERGNAPNLAAEINDSLADKIPQNPIIVWAAPPFSEVFNSTESWDVDGSLYPNTEEASIAMSALRDAIRLTTALQPTWWFIEHPKSLVRKMPLFAGFNRGYPSRNRQTVRHDEFGGNSTIETDVWTNAYWWIPRPGERDAASGVDSLKRVPPFAIAQMFEQLEQYQRTGSYGPKA